MATRISTQFNTDSVLTIAANTLVQRMSLRRFRARELVRLSIAIPPVDFISWLGSLDANNRSYFCHRDQTLVLAGLGVAAELTALTPGAVGRVFDQAQQMVEDTDALWVGGCSYNGRGGTRQWQGFPGARFVLPLIELREYRGQFTLAFNLYAESFGEWQTQLLAINSLVQQLHYHPVHQAGQIHVEHRRDSLSLALWRAQVGEALAKIQAGELDKVVLAREVLLELSGSANALEALRVLQRVNPGCYGFAIESDGKWFFGCSPERLFLRNGRDVNTEALAGTVKRGTSLQEDLMLESFLRSDPKLVLEHELVARAITESLAPFAQTVHSDSPVHLVKLGRIQHRCQALSATLRGEVSNGDLYASLHPTPAICGYPRKQAQAFIQEIEQLGRGWYSGAVGIIGANTCELSVAIRSALSDQNRLWLYSGVGIVEGSNADSEWQELESKLESLLFVLGHTAYTIRCDA